MNPYLAAMLAALALDFGVNALARHLGRAALDPALPPEFAGLYDAGNYRTAQAYARDNLGLEAAADTARALAVAAALLLGFFPWLDAALRTAGLGETLTGLAYVSVLGLASDLLSLPFQAYDTFVLEARYGFNRTIWATFATDRLKGLALSAAIGWPVLAAVLWFFGALGPWAWLAATLLAAVVMVALTFLGPALILPLFNTFTPLPGGPLRQALEAYARAQGFALDGVFVMDGSRRSTKANAFFTGLGARKRIALYDTLINEHPAEEVVAILAHEVGHDRLGHVRWMLLAGLARTSLLFGLLQMFLGSGGLYAAFGMAPSAHAGLVFFLLLYGPASLVLEAAFGAMSRSFEFAADGFAARTTSPQAMATALRRLAVSSLTNLTPHPLQVWLHFSHPPVLQRIRRLEAGMLQA